MLSEEQLAPLRQRLEAARERLMQQLSEDESTDDATPGMATSGHAQWEQSTASNHIADDATELFLQEEEMTIDMNLRAMLEEIDRALQRMDQGTYGKCERCGNPIPLRRLEARPFSILCLECKTKEEQSLAQSRRLAEPRRSI